MKVDDTPTVPNRPEHLPHIFDGEALYRTAHGVHLRIFADEGAVSIIPQGHGEDVTMSPLDVLIVTRMLEAFAELANEQR